MSFLRRHFAVSKLDAVVIAGIVLVLIALLLPNVEQSRGDARRAQCRINLKRIGLALHQYHERHGSFPPVVSYGPDGKPWHSWRVLLLPYLDPPSLGHPASSLADRYDFDEPWDSPANLAAVAGSPVPLAFGCPADEAASRDKTTSYVAVVGERTMWPPRGSISLTEVPDGAGVTVQVVERVGSGILWTEPRDVAFAPAVFDLKALKVGPKVSDTGGKPETRFLSHGHVALADGAAWFLPEDTPSETVKSLLLRDDGGPEELP